MEWRCEWCGKPHEENDPPCDNCGHGTFEKAVVPVADAESDLGTNATVWVCTECGREHTKHTPPCARCGNEKLVRQRQEVDDAELTAPGYLDLVTPQYVLGLVAVLALAVLFVLGLTGVVSLPGFGTGVPAVADVPGSADAVGNVSLSEAKSAYLAQINDAQREAGGVELQRSKRLDEVATFYNQRRVKAAAGTGQVPSQQRARELIGDTCSGSVYVISPRVDGTRYNSAAGLASAFSDVYRSGGLDGDLEGKTGFDMHAAPDGTVYLTQFVC